MNTSKGGSPLINHHNLENDMTTPNTLPKMNTVNASYLMDQLSSLYVLAAYQNKNKTYIRSNLKALGVKGMNTPEAKAMNAIQLTQFITDSINMISAITGEAVLPCCSEWLSLTHRAVRTYFTCTTESALPPGYEGYDENNLIVSPAFVKKFVSDFADYAESVPRA